MAKSETWTGALAAVPLYYPEERGLIKQNGASDVRAEGEITHSRQPGIHLRKVRVLQRVLGRDTFRWIIGQHFGH